MKSFIKYITEIFDNSYSFTKGESVDPAHTHKYTFVDDKAKRFNVYIHHDRDLRDEAEITFARADSLDLGATGEHPHDAHKIMGTVRSIVKQHIANHPQLKNIGFSGETASRNRLYTRISRNHGGSSRNGYHVIPVTESHRYIAEIFAEPEDSNFTHEGKDYDLNGLLSATLGNEPKDIRVDELSWLMKYDPMTLNDKNRIDNADLSAPLLVIREPEEDNKLVVIDGMHRLAKAVKTGVPNLPCIEIDHELLNRYKIGK